MRYADKVTIITGGSHGIGAGCVRVFVEAGAKVVFCSRGETEGQALAAEVNAKGQGRAEFVRCDVSKEADCAKMAASRRSSPCVLWGAPRRRRFRASRAGMRGDAPTRP